jgi:uncharacterized surface protein with fasciclin (FAS1) repeats
MRFFGLFCGKKNNLRNNEQTFDNNNLFRHNLDTSALPGSKMKMKTKHEHRNENAGTACRRVIECRFGRPLNFALPIRVRVKHKPQNTRHNMKNIRITTVAAMMAAVTLTFSAFGQGKPAYAAAAKPGSSTIVGIVLANDGEFDVLQAAVVRAGLVDALNGKGQFTVFAPTDAAFISTLGVADEAEAIETINALPLDALTNILLYHVTEGRRTSKSVLAAPQYEMLNGQYLKRSQLAAAGIAATDISASNGIIHVINSVLIP